MYNFAYRDIVIVSIRVRVISSKVPSEIPEPLLEKTKYTKMHKILGETYFFVIS